MVINLSVVIPTLNSERTIGVALKALFKNVYPRDHFEVVVVDGGSCDKTLEIIMEFPVKVLTTKKKGAAAARNLGIKNAKGKIICFTDSDCVVPKNWLSKIHRFFANNKNADGVGGPILPYRHKNVNAIATNNARIFLEMMRFPKKKEKSYIDSLWDH